MLLAGCGVVDVHPSGPPIHSNTEWVLLPWLNRAEAPRVGERLEPVLATLLRARGVEMVRRTPPLDAADQLPILDDDFRLARAKEWALQEGIQYGVLGTITEWRYKAGLDGEPAVGLSLEIVELATQRTVWSASGARAGWGRESLSGAAQKLLRELLEELEVTASAPAPAREDLRVAAPAEELTESRTEESNDSAAAENHE